MHEPTCFFYAHHRGDRWTLEATGAGTDIATSYARENAHEFCLKFKWPKQRGFTYSVYGGPENSNFLANEMSRKGNHFCCVWHAESCREDFCFTAVHAPCDDFDFAKWASDLDVESVEFEAVMVVRNLWPTNP